MPVNLDDITMPCHSEPFAELRINSAKDLRWLPDRLRRDLSVTCESSPRSPEPFGKFKMYLPKAPCHSERSEESEHQTGTDSSLSSVAQNDMKRSEVIYYVGYECCYS